MKEAAYKGLVRPVLEYGSSVGTLTLMASRVQNRAAKFMTGNYVFETGSMTGILGQLKWESLKKRRKDNILILLYKGLKGKASIPSDDVIPKNMRCRNQLLYFSYNQLAKKRTKDSFFIVGQLTESVSPRFGFIMVVIMIYLFVQDDSLPS